ncbi:hypothetical protein SLS60_007246 [Paraconiothyrium brasiliense]|uniref:O-methyltransferase C-terminal domain-containing protein n=1 Tax=Paraconiothyrium brasiliense TaxID=300254 RepID=A0ABR3R9A7_9PLEO
MSEEPRILKLAREISEQAGVLGDYFAAHNLPFPSLDATAALSVQIPEDEVELQKTRVSTIEACEELRAILMGPRELLALNVKYLNLTIGAWTANTSLRAILRYKLYESFPVGGQSSFDAIADASGLNAYDVRRLIRHGILNHHLFEEPSPGVVAHSALTKALAEDPDLRDAIQNAVEEFLPSSYRLVDAMERWPKSEENWETAFSLAHDTNSSMWEYFRAHPEKGSRFAKAMSYSSGKKDHDTDLLLANVAWPDDGVVVDVGGSHGSIAISIARRFPKVKCIVQDLPDVIQEGKKQLPADLGERVEFMAQ